MENKKKIIIISIATILSIAILSVIIYFIVSGVFKTKDINGKVQNDYTKLNSFENNMETIATGIANGYDSQYFSREIGELDEVILSGISYDTFGVNKDVINKIYSYISKTPNKDIKKYYGDWDVKYKYSDNLEPIKYGTDMGVSTDNTNGNTTTGNTDTSIPQSKTVKGIDALLSDPNYNDNNSLSEEEWNSIVSSNERSYRENNLLSVKEVLKDSSNSNTNKYYFTNDKSPNKKCVINITYDNLGYITDIKVLRGDGGAE